MKKNYGASVNSHIENVFNNMINDVSYIKLATYSSMGKQFFVDKIYFF